MVFGVGKWLVKASNMLRFCCSGDDVDDLAKIFSQPGKKGICFIDVPMTNTWAIGSWG